MTSLYTLEDTAPGTDLAVGSDETNLDADEWPAWARAHIPVDELTPPAATRRKLSRPALSLRRDTTTEADAATTTELPVVALDATDPVIDEPDRWHAPSARPRVTSRVVIGFAAGALIAAAAGGAGVTLLATGQDTTPIVTAEPLPFPGPAASPVADYCPDRTEGVLLTTAGPGSESTASGVIAAFDYAYYTQRDGARVSALMVKPPNTVAVIQSAIDAVPTGTRACVTTSPTSDPMVFHVDVKLHAPNRADSALHQRITVAASGTKFKIARVEDR
ncbi:MAG: hypothetical protein LLG14_20260 [Nocardiaceae bacterium]|nr:hypothetical protein [Nocardiaceae bacterium]